ncbi:MAG: chemosensory pili system protein ChpA (sensor histidine kinase/response regulator) [Candidatus Endobugula sp.]|jgi:chemosensory pili system protein ChpA (sensor histidine kinase/response regulator)
MADNRQYMALEWVIRDIKDTLVQAQRALESYVREPSDVIQLKFCLTYIHQVYGSLHMSGFYSGAMLASEIEALTQSVLDRQVSHEKEALSVLQKAIVELPVYLESALETKTDQPKLVFSLLNDLRATRGANLVSECTLFSPNLSYAQEIRGKKHPIVNDLKQLRLILSKLRQMYQVAAASVIHKKNTGENFAYLIKVSHRLEKLLQGTHRLALWEIVSVFIVGLQTNLIEDTASIKKLLRELDNELKTLIEGGEEVLNQYTSDELLKNLLYYLASLEETTPEIDHLSECYELDGSIVSNSNNNVPNTDGMASYNAIADSTFSDLNAVKATLAECRTSDTFIDDTQWVASKLNQIADTLAMLSVNQLRQKILDSVSIMTGLASDQSLASEKLSVVDRYIDEVELELEKKLAEKQQSLPSAHRQFSKEEDLALQESRNGLEEAKDAVVNYIATQWNIKNLQPVPDLLREVSEKLFKVSLSTSAEILSVSANYIEMTMIHQSAQPEWEQLDSLADVIASIDYFLEVLSMTKEEDVAILAGAESGLCKLGIPPQRVKNIMRGIVANDTSEEAVVEEKLDEIPDIDDETEAEILEIFAEEAVEVQETIADFLPSWEAEFKDQEALIEIRRAFHTLKGSGRIVKAMDIGELSWSIENLLNRILDNTLTPTKIQMGLIHKVLALLPSMVTAFSQRQPIADKALCEQYQIWAHDLVSNDAPQDLVAYLALDGAIQKDNGQGIVEGIDLQEDDIDVQLWEIFGSEAETHLIVIREYIMAMESASPFFELPSDSTQRAMHTLKGSAHMAEITPIALLMTPMELFVKDLRAYQVSIDEDILQLLKDSVSYTEDALEQISRLIYPKIEKLDLFLARVAELRERSVGHLIRHEEDDGPKVDPAFLEKLMNEGMNLLLDIDGVIDGWKAVPASHQQWRAMANEVANVQHGAERANLDTMATLSEEIYKQYESLIAQSLVANDQLYDTLLDAHYALLDVIDAIAGGQDLPPANEGVLKALRDLSTTHAVSIITGKGITEDESVELSVQSSQDSISELSKNTLLVANPSAPEWENVKNPDLAEQITDAPVVPTSLLPEECQSIAHFVPDEADDEIIEIFMEEAAELLEDLDATIDDWESGGDATLSNENLQRLLHTFKGGARLTGLASLGDVAHDFESYLVSQFKNGLSENVLSTIHDYQDRLIHGVSKIGVNQVIDDFSASAQNAIEHTTPVPDNITHEPVIAVSKEDVTQGVEGEPYDIVDNYIDQSAAEIDDPENRYRENSLLPPLFDDMAKEDGGGQEQSLLANDEKPDGQTEVLKHKDQKEASTGNLHSGLSEGLGEVSSSNNTDSAEVDTDGRVAAASPFEPHYRPQDNVVTFPSATSSNASILAPVSSDEIAGIPARIGNDIVYSSTLPSKNIMTNNNGETNTATARRPAAQETVKVSAELMEELVNLAGETSISRGRMEEQMNGLGSSLEEMEQTVGRLDEQLRRLDIETEAQVIFRQEQLSEQEDFDPLEMDRYSQLQQLSRSLSESASDLKDLKQTLSNKTRDAETVLLQQSRINTELQEGLMRSRMVPFSRIVPRLRRIVRQVSSELGKEVAIEFDHTEGELDRNMMERMVAPLEHMLRNAVDHGIESTDKRKQVDKPAAGRITLSLSREGSNVLILLTDDGAGMNVDRIRQKAIQQERMNAGAQLSDKDILQFIFQAGFSTAESVTQISGRGVGMDVVSSEIKQLGGSIDISSVEGQGTQFTIRLPFTVSVNRALMINMGDDRYAIPLNSIEGIARIAPEDLANYYSDPDSRFHYAGTDYQLQYMGTLLNKNVLPRVDGHQLPVPVLLVRSADHSVAIQVDSLNGSQEIVVKTLGAQFSAVQGLSGATIMGDGNVVVILDANAMIRQQYALPTIYSLSEKNEKIKQQVINRNPIVMVVDDSVTVRKVTTRFLERAGFDVITAKDGVNAIEVLRDQIPDLMLLDIEMPRMDGFEVARRVRATTQTQHMPIIMITSRTGEKHRQTGLTAGANKYMGKPFQEEMLLDNIHQLLHIER